jgi:competence protein ComEC
LNGKKGALDWVQSPTLQGGAAKISLNYALPFSDTKFSLKIEVLGEDGNAFTEVVEKTSVTPKTIYELVVELPEPVLGNVSVKISNGGLSNTTSNKDRVAIWDVKVFGAEIVEAGNAKLDVHFLELGNYYTGDCTFIKAGDVDILIDAGSRQSSATTISAYINQYCTDGVLEYVVATHAHQDHIAGFVGSSGDGIFDQYRVGTLIDFPKTDADTQVYKNYVTKRSALIENGTKHYTALEWWDGQDGLTRSIELASGIFMTVLYQDFYKQSASTENNYSVCLMISQGQNNYLFTGDLETAGEESLLKNNALPKINVYKAGHHGSKTSSSEALLAVIQPEIICVCCCCGSDEYATVNESQYPMQVTVERWAKYTSRIYVTSLAVNDESGDTVDVTSMNGNICLSSYGGAITVSCSNNNTVLKDSEWFKKYRVWPSWGV